MRKFVIAVTISGLGSGIVGYFIREVLRQWGILDPYAQEIGMWLGLNIPLAWLWNGIGILTGLALWAVAIFLISKFSQSIHKSVDLPPDIEGRPDFECFISEAYAKGEKAPKRGTVIAMVRVRNMEEPSSILRADLELSIAGKSVEIESMNPVSITYPSQGFMVTYGRMDFLLNKGKTAITRAEPRRGYLVGRIPSDLLKDGEPARVSAYVSDNHGRTTVGRKDIVARQPGTTGPLAGNDLMKAIPIDEYKSQKGPQ